MRPSNLLISTLLLATVGCDGQPASRQPPLDGSVPHTGADGPVTPAFDEGLESDTELPDSASAPTVAFISPADGATVSNPVLFKVAATRVEQVRILADQTYGLGPAWDPTNKSTLLYRFSGTGFARALKVEGLVAGQVVASAQLTITVKPDPCEDLFFVKKFDANNQDPTLDLVQIREDSLATLRKAVADLQSCGAKVTLGGLLSLLYFEGLFRVAAFNTRCEENSYHKTASGCDTVAEALYSYQFGLGAMHTSNFHPCKGGSYTQKMRQSFLAEAAAAGFSTSSSLVTSQIAARFQQVCPGSTPSAVDYYLLGAHDSFGIPKDTAGNHLAAYGKFPLFTPAVSVGLAFAALKTSCASIVSDRKAIAVYGGGDSSYGGTAKQDQILAYYQSFKASSCP